jgi:hypothetical protein
MSVRVRHAAPKALKEACDCANIFSSDLFHFIILERYMRYLHTSFMGSYYIDCTLNRKEDMMGEMLYTITYLDPVAGEERTVVAKADQLKDIPTGIVHKVKSWAHFYDAIDSGAKTHELRHDDRNYQVGDTLLLQRFDNIEGEYTGQEREVLITYITNRNKPCAFSGSVLQRDYCILSIKRI